MQPSKKINPENLSISISNLRNGETLCYSLVLIKGQILSVDQKSWPLTNITLRQYTNKQSSPVISEWPVNNLEFKCIVTLPFGSSHLSFDYCGAHTDLVINHQPRKTPFHVLPVYIICRGHDGNFQAPAEEENTIDSACKRVAIGARLIQCLTAEKLVEAGYERKTFQLEQDLSPSSPECVVFHSQLPLEDARKMQPYELWDYFGRELMMSVLASDNRKFLAFLSYTRYTLKSPDCKPKTYDDMISMMEGHVALGGGGLAIFGTGCLHTWASKVEEVVPRFLNDCKVDTQHFMDDSCYRGTYGGCYATTLGSVCHELGHTFDLGHSSEGIMSRGFDNVDLVFTLQSRNDNDKRIGFRERNVNSPVFRELPQHSTVCFNRVLNVSYSESSPIKRPQSGTHRNISVTHNGNANISKAASNNLTTEIHDGSCNNVLADPKTEFHPPEKDDTAKSSGDGTFWSRSCAALLNYHRWFNDESRPQDSSGNLQFNSEKNAVISPAGIRVVEVRDESGLVLCSWEFLDRRGKDQFCVPPEACKAPAHVLVAVDSAGNILKHSLAQIV